MAGGFAGLPYHGTRNHDTYAVVANYRESVPNEYRGQLLHQAVVLCVNFVLFVLARTSGVIYRVRVSGFALAAVVAAAAAAAAVVVDLIRWWVSVVVVALASAVLVLLTVHGC